MQKKIGDDFTPISSDHLDGARYNQIEHTMVVRFKNGSVYHVHGVSQAEYQDFMDAPSQGEHYHRFIKDQYRIERIK